MAVLRGAESRAGRASGAAVHRGARYRLCGFGSSAPIGSLRSRKEGLGPLAYRPPELVDAAALLTVEYVVDASHDLWAAGCVCGELLDGEQMLPARGVGHYALLHSTLASMPPKSTDTTVRKYRIPKGVAVHGEEGSRSPCSPTTQGKAARRPICLPTVARPRVTLRQKRVLCANSRQAR